MQEIYTDYEGTNNVPKSLESGTALRFDSGKPNWHLVHFRSLEPLVRVLEFGASKYGTFNWQKPFEKERILNSAMRHLMKLMDGEELDSESGLPHIGHLMANAMFYSYHYGIYNKGNSNNSDHGPRLGNKRNGAVEGSNNTDLVNKFPKGDSINTGIKTDALGNSVLPNKITTV